MVHLWFSLMLWELIIRHTWLRMNQDYTLLSKNVSKLSLFADYDLTEFLNNQFQVSIGLHDLTAGLFSIPILEGSEHNKSFNLEAPTTAANAMRVIRAMQVKTNIVGR